ncbi:MAG: deoxyribose-phosphate aldolase [Clostridiales bacterium]|jgi:deoxyribose-phosphate aldolase|nr:deoxyribose-phosphate aldolase [Clostridiales bacterium]
MDSREMLQRVDHTILKATATKEEVLAICKEAYENSMASACIPPSFVKAAREAYADLAVCTVIGFPLGYSASSAKVAEIAEAERSGATEFDVVVNLGHVKDKRFSEITEEIKACKEACAGKVLKVIVETCYLTEEEKVELCKCVTEGGADYIKTSTGFGTGGAELKDIELFKANIGPNVKIKASGGIRTKEQIEAFIGAGCDRIGASSALKALLG